MLHFTTGCSGIIVNSSSSSTGVSDMQRVRSNYKVCHRQFTINNKLLRISNDWWTFYQSEQSQCIPVIMPCHSLAFPCASLNRRRVELQPPGRIACNPEPTGDAHGRVSWVMRVNVSCNMASEDEWQTPWNNLIQMWTAANVLWSSHKPMKEGIEQGTTWGACHYVCLLVQKTLFHRNLSIVEEEEGAGNRVDWALRCQVLCQTLVAGLNATLHVLSVLSCPVGSYFLPFVVWKIHVIFWPVSCE